jgi:hypothetical protein
MRRVHGLPINMTGMEAKMAIRTRDGLLIAEPICAVDSVADEIVIGMPHTVTADLDFDTAIHDLDVLQGEGLSSGCLRGW